MSECLKTALAGAAHRNPLQGSSERGRNRERKRDRESDRERESAKSKGAGKERENKKNKTTEEKKSKTGAWRALLITAEALSVTTCRSRMASSPAL